MFDALTATLLGTPAPCDCVCRETARGWVLSDAEERQRCKPPSSTCLNTNSTVMSAVLQKDRLSRRSCCFSGKFLISQESQTSRAELIEDDLSWRAPLANFPHYPKSSGAARRTTYILITSCESRFFFFFFFLFFF